MWFQTACLATLSIKGTTWQETEKFEMRILHLPVLISTQLRQHAGRSNSGDGADG